MWCVAVFAFNMPGRPTKAAAGVFSRCMYIGGGGNRMAEETGGGIRIGCENLLEICAWTADTVTGITDFFFSILVAQIKRLGGVAAVTTGT